MQDSNCMLALDLLSVLTGSDRKRASQTLTRVASKPETASLLTLRHSANSGMKKPRKLISFSNAIQLLLVLPKRTVSLHIRKSVAGVLSDFFEASVDHSPRVEETVESLTLKQTLLRIEQQTADLEQQRKQQPLNNLKSCFELLQQCGPLSEEELQGFKRMVTQQIAITLFPQTRWTSIPHVPMLVSTAVKTRSPAKAKGWPVSRMDRCSEYAGDE